MVLVTGGTGFLGAYILDNLVKKNIPCRAIRRSHKLPFFIAPEVAEKIEWVDGDVTDTTSLEDAMQGVDCVIHAAAVVSFHHRDRRQMNKVNVEGTCNVVNIALENSVGRIIHISSVAALGRTTKKEMINEERKWEETKSNTSYAISKHHAEMEVWRGLAEGLNGIILNPSTILGFGNWHQSSCAIFRSAYKEFPWYSEGLNGFVGVEDVAELAVQLSQSHISGRRFIVNAENRSFRDLFNAMADGFHKKRPYRKATPFLGEIAWRLEGLKSLFADGRPLLTKESARVAHSKTEFDNSALLKELGSFTYQPLDSVIKKSCEKYLDAVSKGALSV